ncbi:MAG: ACP S-malonyltransferase [Candidatus Xenobiia bacterium LiM19]
MMRKIAFVFPGQGAQKVGMGREMAERFPEAREVFDKADSTLGFSLSNLCWEGPEEELRKTVNTQPAILTTSVACLRMLEREQITPIMVAGHSVGEYAALVAAGVLTFEEALTLVRRRGELMQEAGNTAPGTMAAVIGMEYKVIREACAQAAMTGVVEVANFNTPDQIVISGEHCAVAKATEILKEKGARKIAPLNVSAAFHSSLMKSAAGQLAAEFDRYSFRNPRVPLVANISALALKDGISICSALKKQILGNVLWADSIKYMISSGVDTFIEVGPGKALSGMIRKIDRYVQVFNVEDSESFDKAREVSADELILEV